MVSHSKMGARTTTAVLVMSTFQAGKVAPNQWQSCVVAARPKKEKMNKNQFSFSFLGRAATTCTKFKVFRKRHLDGKSTNVRTTETGENTAGYEKAKVKDEAVEAKDGKTETEDIGELHD
jgi:hypothetical protein